MLLVTVTAGKELNGKLELPDGDDDDCVIIGEEAPGTSTSQRTDGRTGSDVLNNNANNAKRPRSETIVIE